MGTRLRPLTDDCPKHMLPIADRPMLEHIMAWLSQQLDDAVAPAAPTSPPATASSATPTAPANPHPLITQAVLSLGYRPDAIEAGYPDKTCAGLPFDCAVEPEPLGTAGGIAYGAAAAGITDTYLAMNGDILCDFSCGDLLRTHRQNQAIATIALKQVADPSRFGVVETDERGRVARFVEKPSPGDSPSNWINAGIYILEPAALAGVPLGQNVSIEREIFPALAERGQLFASKCRGVWFDAGTPQAFMEAQFHKAGLPALGGSELDGSAGSDGLDLGSSDTSSDTSATPSYVHPRADLSPSAGLSHSVVMSGVRVGERARIERSVLLPGCVIGADVVVRDSIIGMTARISDRAAVTNLSVVCGNVEAGQNLSAARHG